MYDDDDYFNSYSEFNEKVEEFKQSLVFNVKAGIKEELERLRRENTRFKALEKEWNKYCTEKDAEVLAEKRKLEEERKDVKKMRLSEIVNEIGVEAWGVDYVRGPKCDKCDEYRQIHFKSPSGRDCMENCSCASSLTYKLVPIILLSFKYPAVPGRKPLFHYYKNEESGVNYDHYVKTSEIYSGESFDEVSRHSIVFLDKAKAEEYRDWLQAKNDSERG